MRPRHEHGRRPSWTGSNVTLNEQKTSIRDGRIDQFDFLGYTFGPLYSWRAGRRYIAASPSKKSLKRFRTSVHLLLRPQETGPWEQVRTRLNATLRGWQNYFSYGTVARTYSSLNRYVYDRVRHFLRHRHTTTHSRGCANSRWSASSADWVSDR